MLTAIEFFHVGVFLQSNIKIKQSTKKSSVQKFPLRFGYPFPDTLDVSVEIFLSHFKLHRFHG